MRFFQAKESYWIYYSLGHPTPEFNQVAWSGATALRHCVNVHKSSSDEARLTHFYYLSGCKYGLKDPWRGHFLPNQAIKPFAYVSSTWTWICHPAQNHPHRQHRHQGWSSSLWSLMGLNFAWAGDSVNYGKCSSLQQSLCANLRSIQTPPCQSCQAGDSYSACKTGQSDTMSYVATFAPLLSYYSWTSLI